MFGSAFVVPFINFRLCGWLEFHIGLSTHTHTQTKPRSSVRLKKKKKLISTTIAQVIISAESGVALTPCVHKTNANQPKNFDDAEQWQY